MNTPKPCDTCRNLYVDAMSKDNPTYQAECKLKIPLGEMNCNKYYKDNGEGDASN